VAEKFDSTIQTLGFYIPTSDPNWQTATDINGYVDPFTVWIYPLDGWQIAQNKEGPKAIKLGENSKYVFSYWMWQECPPDLCETITSSEIKTILSTFKFTE